MSALGTWQALDAAPMTPPAARDRASLLRFEAAALPSAILDVYDWRSRSADSFERTARRLMWQRCAKCEGCAQCA